MNLTKIIKREILITSLTVIGIAITFLGLTYAIYFTIDEKNIGTVSFGQLSFDMCMDESCSTGGTTYGTTITGDVYPMNTTEGTSQTPYLFKVTNNATEVMYTKVYAAKEGLSSDYTNVKLAAKVQGTSTYSYADLTQDASVLIDLQVPAGQTKIIEVYMWLDEEASNEVIGKTVTVFINAMGYYKPDDPNNLHTGDKFVANANTAILQGQTFDYTGNYQEFEAPVSGYYFIETWGAQGGNAKYNTQYYGGKGGYSSGYLYLSKGEKLYIYVGGMGISHSGTSTDTPTENGNGYNGGAAGHFVANNSNGGGGGGATDIRYFGNTTPSDEQLAWDSELGLNSRIMVTGGGGGAESHSSSPSYSGDGGSGGTLVGQDAQKSSTTCYRYGSGASQTSSGQLVACSSSYTTANSGSFGTGGVYHSGGGGGYYGGGAGQHTSAGGGSSFISGYAGSNAITSANSRTHTNNTLHYSGKYFLAGSMKSGIREGNGQAKIKYVGLLSRTNNKLDGVRYVKDCINGNSVDSNNHWVEVQAIKDGTNIALSKTVSGDTTSQLVVDGIITSSSNALGGSGNKCVIVDLGNTYDLDEIAVWHPYDDGRVYNDNITYVSSDNSTWVELISEIMPENPNGKRANAYGEVINGYIQDGLLVWYDGISNTGTDRSTSTTTWKNLAGSSYDGTITNGTWENDNLYLSGSSSGVVSASTISYGTSNTSEAVVKISNTPAFVIDMRNSSGVGMQPLYSSNSAATFQIYASASGSSNYALTSYYNTKASFSALLNSNGNKLYTNGILAASDTVTKGMSGSANLYVGRRYSNSSNLKGNVYSVRFYDRVLTEDEIYHNYLIDKERFGLE